MKLFNRYLLGSVLLLASANLYACWDKSNSDQGNFSNCLTSAKLGDKESQYVLGWIYEKGRGVQKDSQQSFEWYRKSAYHGHVVAQYKIALMYLEEEDAVPKDSQKALEWLKRAADKGYAKAIIKIGNMYFEGIDGAKKNYSFAIRRYKQLGNKGTPESKYRLGWMYEHGKDLKRILNWHSTGMRKQLKRELQSIS